MRIGPNNQRKMGEFKKSVSSQITENTEKEGGGGRAGKFTKSVASNSYP